MMDHVIDHSHNALPEEMEGVTSIDNQIIEPMSQAPSLPSPDKGPKSKIMQHAGYRETSAMKYPRGKEVDSERRNQGVAQEARGSPHPIRAAPRKESQAEEMNSILEPRSTISRTEYVKLQQQQSEAKETLQAYEWKMQRLERDLQDCKDEIISLQPTRQVQEYKIVDGWVELCNFINIWVDEDSGGMDEIGPLSKRYGRGKLTIVDELVKLEEQYQTITRNSGILDDALRHEVFGFLLQYILRKEIPILGLTLEEKALIDTVERSLGDMEPRTDPARINLWRSETLHGLCAGAEFSRRQDSKARSIGDYAQQWLKPLLSSPPSEAMPILQQKIVGKAINLAKTIRCSTTDYYFDSMSSVTTFYENDLDKFQLRDVMSGRLVKSESAPPRNHAGAIGESIFVIQPALCRRQQGKEDILLRKPVILIRLLEAQNLGTTHMMGSHK